MTNLIITIGLVVFCSFWLTVGIVIYRKWRSTRKKGGADTSAPTATTNGVLKVLTTGKAVKLGLLLVSYLLVYWWIDWSGTPLGKAVEGAVGPINHKTTELLPWLLYWVPILLGVIWGIKILLAKDSGSGGEHKTAGNGLIVAAAIMALVGAAWTIGYKWSGNTAPIVANLIHSEKLLIEVPIEPKGKKIGITLPAEPRAWANTGKNHYFCARAMAPALKEVLGPVSALQEKRERDMPGHLAVELHPQLRHLAEENGIRTVKLHVWRVTRNWSERPPCP